MFSKRNFFYKQKVQDGQLLYLVNDIYATDLEKAFKVSVQSQPKRRRLSLREYEGTVFIGENIVNAVFCNSLLSPQLELASIKGEGTEELIEWVESQLKKYKTKYMLRQLTFYLYLMMLPMLSFTEVLCFKEKNGNMAITVSFMMIMVIMIYHAVRKI